MIECKDIQKVYTTGEIENIVLKKVSFTIKDGEFVAIMGPSGSGKSTLMHIIGCLDVATTGSYMLDDEDVSRLSDDELAKIRNSKIGFVFQSFNLLSRSSVLRNVSLPLVYSQVPERQRIELTERALKLASFPEQFWQHKPNQLSGGMTQRVAIARALVNNPKIILADEPTGNLDTKTGGAVISTFQNLHSKLGRTIILITHEKYIAEHAERIIHIRDGEIIEDEMVKNRRIINSAIEI